jgi:ATP-dependent RNA helicase DHX57
LFPRIFFLSTCRLGRVKKMGGGWGEEGRGRMDGRLEGGRRREGGRREEGGGRRKEEGGRRKEGE